MLNVVSRLNAATDSTRESRAPASAKSSNGKVSQAEADELRKLKARDAEVRAHEQAHATTGGAYAGAPSFEYQRGPDGRNYAVGGEVSIDVSAIPGDPEATIRKMEQVQRAALAPAEPSGADRAVAATADATMLAARSELMSSDEHKTNGTEANAAGDAARQILGALQRRSAGTNAYDVAPSRAARNAVDIAS